MRLSDDEKCSLKEVVDYFQQEDRAIRERQIRTWRRLKLFWEGFQRTWYSEVAHDWRIWDETETSDETNQAYYDKPVNIFRAYLESIIAALSVTVPPVKCYPDDADDTLDLITAKTGDKIAELLYRHNNVSLLWLHALFIFCTEGLIGCYCYPKEDESYGTYEKKEYKEVDEEHQIAKCPECGHVLSDSVVGSDGKVNPQTEQLDEKLKQNEDKFQPTDEDVPVQDYINDNGTEYCPGCAQQITPYLMNETVVITRLVGITNEPKSRICMEAYGGLYMKVANYARTQADTPYLILSRELHYSTAIQDYPEVDTKGLRAKIKASTGPRDPYEQWGRLSPQYQNAYPEGVVTVRHAWLRPAAFNILDDEIAKRLKKKFPNGAKIVYINDEFAKCENECLDDCWTLTYNPMSDYLHHDPLGLLLVSVQELINDLISLTTQTIEHGIPQTFADPEVLNFNAYRQMETTPGAVYEAKAKSGKTLSDGFYEVKTATLSQEILPFFQQLETQGQMVSGALPSLFGGPQSNTGGDTASGYSMSRAQALQRLQNIWKMLTMWWKDIFGKAIPMFIEEVKSDEKDVQRKPDGSFYNVFLRKAEMEGKIGKVELEANENLPITWAQRKDVLMQLLQTGQQEILQILGSPENLPIIREAIGLDNFFVPGEDDIEKQLDEIKLLISSQPLPDPNTGQEESSVPIEVMYDNHGIQFEMCRKWIISEEGQLAKTDNPNGYRNVLLHGLEHKNAMMPPQIPAPDGKGAPPLEKPNQPDMSAAPITGEGNVPSN